MTSTGRAITYHSACWCVTEFIEIGQPDALCKYCARCTIIALHFFEKTQNAIMLLLELYILQIAFPNCPQSVSNFSKGLRVYNYQVRKTILCLHFIITQRLNTIAILKSNYTECCLLRGHEIAFQRGQCLSELSLPAPVVMHIYK